MSLDHTFMSIIFFPKAQTFRSTDITLNLVGCFTHDIVVITISNWK